MPRRAIGEFAELCRRGYTTVGRQVAELEAWGLVGQQVSALDARIKEAVITEQGCKMARALDGARERLSKAVLAGWASRDVGELARLLHKLADNGLEFVKTERARDA